MVFDIPVFEEGWQSRGGIAVARGNVSLFRTDHQHRLDYKAAFARFYRFVDPLEGESLNQALVGEAPRKMVLD